MWKAFLFELEKYRVISRFESFLINKSLGQKIQYSCYCWIQMGLERWTCSGGVLPATLILRGWWAPSIPAGFPGSNVQSLLVLTSHDRLNLRLRRVDACLWPRTVLQLLTKCHSEGSDARWNLEQLYFPPVELHQCKATIGKIRINHNVEKFLSTLDFTMESVKRS